MTDNNTTAETTNAADNIHRTPALDKMGLARCRKDNKLFSWRKGGACKVCGARVEDAPTAPTTAPTVKPKRARKTTPAPADRKLVADAYSAAADESVLRALATFLAALPKNEAEGYFRGMESANDVRAFVANVPAIRLTDLHRALAETPAPEAPAAPVKDSKRKRDGSAAAASKKKGNKS